MTTPSPSPSLNTSSNYYDEKYEFDCPQKVDFNDSNIDDPEDHADRWFDQHEPSKSKNNNMSHTDILDDILQDVDGNGNVRKDVLVTDQEFNALIEDDEEDENINTGINNNHAH